MANHLLIDIGNTRAKASVRNGDTCLCFRTWTDDSTEVFERMLADFHPTAIAYSNVGQPRPLLDKAMQQCGLPVLRVCGNMPSPVKDAPPELGADQLAAIVGAMTLKPQTDLLVIDSGTCLTYDFVSREGHLLGCNISPGLFLRLQAMHDHTAALPLVSPEGEVPPMGYDTPTAMRCGAVMGIHFEIEGAVAYALKQNPALHTFLTGGDPLSFNDVVASHISIEPQLVEIGLDALLAYHNIP